MARQLSITFTKLFSNITASTVWCEDPETKVVWITMLAMSDRLGRVSASVPGLAAVARVPVPACRTAIAKFLAPDPDSRSKEAEGRRIEEIDGGWRLINYVKYRELRDEEERKLYKAQWARESRQKRRQSGQAVDNVDRGGPQSTHAEADADAYKNSERASPVDNSAHPESRNANNGSRKISESEAAQVWREITSSDGKRPERTQRVQAAIDAAGGIPRIRLRTEYESEKIKRAFCKAYDDHS